MALWATTLSTSCFVSKLRFYSLPAVDLQTYQRFMALNLKTTNDLWQFSCLRNLSYHSRDTNTVFNEEKFRFLKSGSSVWENTKTYVPFIRTRRRSLGRLVDVEMGRLLRHESFRNPNATTFYWQTCVRKLANADSRQSSHCAHIHHNYSTISNENWNGGKGVDGVTKCTCRVSRPIQQLRNEPKDNATTWLVNMVVTRHRRRRRWHWDWTLVCIQECALINVQSFWYDGGSSVLVLFIFLAIWKTLPVFARCKQRLSLKLFN